jgi:predicted DCC family thiol-disulfide oxidoreductase YuxK
MSLESPTIPAANACPLPDPAERANSDVVIYDGHCRICTGYVNRLARWDWRGQLSYLSLHDPRVKELCPQLTHDDMMRQMYVIDSRRNAYGGAAAFRYLSRRLPILWPAAPFLHIPGSLPLWDYLYQLVATRRYRFGKLDDCPDGACAVHFGQRGKTDSQPEKPKN